MSNIEELVIEDRLIVVSSLAREADISGGSVCNILHMGVDRI